MQDFIESYPFTTPRLAFAPPFADYVEDVVLAADVMQHVGIPAGAGFVLLSFDGDVRVKIGIPATVLALPAISTTNGTGSELNPAARRIPATLADGSTIPSHIVLRAALACKGSLAFYK
jgi:hypothetical protein